jgi:hypothetical protein
MVRKTGPNISGPPDVGGNGHSLGILDPNHLDRLLTQTSMPNVAHELVKPGKDPAQLMMRCNFKNERQLNAAVLLLAKYEKFHMERHKTMLLNRLAGSTSVGGLSRRELLQAATGIVAPSLYNVKNFGNDGKKDKGRDEL